MLARAQKWGNSIAVRIPKAIAEDAGIREDDQLDIEVVEGAVVLTHRRPLQYRLDDLLERITDANLHEEQDFGPPVGNEAL
jgi:antitoxin MazE